MLDKARRRKFKHYRDRRWSPYALSNRLHKSIKANDSADDRLKDYQETTAVQGSNRPHRMNQQERQERYQRWFEAWSSE